MNISSRGKLPNRKKFLKTFRNFYLENDIIEFRSQALVVTILTYSSQDYKDHYHKMIFTKIVITNFHKKNLKIDIHALQKNSDDEI